MDLKDWTEFKWIWENNGYTEPDAGGERFDINDALSTSHAGLLFPKVVNRIIKEAGEPLLVGTSLLTEIRYKYGQMISFPAVGALAAADIGDGGEYPEVSLDMGGGTVTASVGKVGLAVKLTEEMIRYSQYDVMSMHLRAMGRAMGRHKEKKIFNFIRAMGVTVFDNLNPGRSLYGVTHGRNMHGVANGSVVVDDIFDCWGQIVTQGYTPNTLIMHPLTWVMFVKDPVLRAFALQNGGGVFFASWTGNPAGKAPWGDKLGVAGGQTITPGTTPDGTNAPHGQTASNLLNFPQNISSAPRLPSYFNIPLLIIVTPFVFFDARRRLTDIYMLDRAELGALIVDEQLNTGRWEDPARDILKVKVRERYGVAVFAEGQAIGVMRNVFVRPNEVVLPAQATIEVSSQIQPIDPSVPISV
ncbi:MAG: phage major capsid protein [Candidatus Thorarchaeota archaeon]|jgi:hypothetical protein